MEKRAKVGWSIGALLLYAFGTPGMISDASFWWDWLKGAPWWLMWIAATVLLIWVHWPTVRMALNRVVPLRPEIQGSIYQILNTNMGPVDVVLSAMVMNRGGKTNLFGWAIVAKVGDDEWQLETRVLRTATQFPRGPDGTTLELDPRGTLERATSFTPLSRGSYRRGWIAGGTNEVRKDILRDPATEWFLRCSDVYGRMWEIGVTGKRAHPKQLPAFGDPDIGAFLQPRLEASGSADNTDTSGPTENMSACGECGAEQVTKGLYMRPLGKDGAVGEKCPRCGFGPGLGVEKVGNTIIGPMP